MSGKGKPVVRKAAPARAPAAKKAVSKRSPGVERRQAKRLDVLWQLNVEVLSRPMPVSVSDISAAGFSVETTTPFEEGEILEFRFTLDGGPSLEVFAESAHGVAKEKVGELQLYLTGFKYVQMDAATKLGLRTLLTEIQKYLAIV
jgi:c-di-GMP-binding flagellar brake protein YcgR